MNFKLSEEQELIKETARSFAKNELAPGAIERDEKKYGLKKQLKRWLNQDLWA